MHSGLLPLLVAAGAVTGLGGCGDGGSRALASSSLTPAAYVKRANAICARGRLRGLRFQPSLSDAQTGKSVAAAIEASVLPAIQDVVDRLYALGAPAGQKPQIKSFLTALQQAVDEGEGLEVPSFERLEPILETPGRLALRSGLSSCAYG